MSQWEALYAVEFNNGMVHVGGSFNVIKRLCYLQKDARTKGIEIKKVFIDRNHHHRLSLLLEYCQAHGKPAIATTYFTHLNFEQLVGFLNNPYHFQSIAPIERGQSNENESGTD